MLPRFHEGERRAQVLAGEELGAEQNGAMISDRVAPAFVPFLQRQGMVVAATQDASGAVWCSVLFGEPGFLVAGGAQVSLNLKQMVKQAGDPFWANLEASSRIGLLALDLETRRRVRINGDFAVRGDSLEVRVAEVFPNCSKYITRRRLGLSGLRESPELTAAGEALGEVQAVTAHRADLLFLATRHPARGLDASHRGGFPGFVELRDQRTLWIPDYAGNSMFNSLGNLLVDAHAGLAIPDFERGRVLMMTGSAEVALGAEERGWTFGVRRWAEVPLPVGFWSEFEEYSGFNPVVPEN